MVSVHIFPYPARTILYRRLRHDVTAAPPRLKAGSGRYCLTVWRLHPSTLRQLLALLP